MSRDDQIKSATQEILEVLRKYDLGAFFVIGGRTLFETRWRFPTWSCFEQVPHPEGSVVRFRTRQGGTGERRAEKDISDSANLARAFAEFLGPAALMSIDTWEELKVKLGAEATRDEDRGAPPPWDLK